MTPSAASGVRGVAITPTLRLHDWFDAIQASARSADLEAVATWHLAPGQPTPTENAIVVTDDAKSIRDLSLVDLVVLMPDPSSAIDAVEQSTGDGFPASAILASQRLAEMSELGRAHRVLGPQALATSSGPLALFDDVLITPPPGVGTIAKDPSTDAACKLLAELYTRTGPERVTHWPLETFNHHQPSLIDARPGSFDLTGRPRFLVNGPYYWMPDGVWTATVRFGADSDAAGRRFRLDWGSVNEWTEQYFTPVHAGIYELELTYRFEQPAPCELRLLITEGCFAGRMDLLSVQIRSDDQPS